MIVKEGEDTRNKPIFRSKKEENFAMKTEKDRSVM